MQTRSPINIFILLLWAALAAAQVPNVDWDRALGGSNYEEIHSLTPTRDGGVLAAATTVSPGDGDISEGRLGSWDYWVVKLDAAGTIEWQGRYGGDQEDRLWVSTQTRDGGYLLGGSSYTSANGDKSEASRGKNDYWIIRLDAAGNLLWEKTIGGDGSDDLRGSVVETADGGFVLAGHSDSGVSGEKTEPNQGGLDFWIVKTDANGNVLWDKTYGGDKQDRMFALIKTQDGGFAVTGSSESGATGHKDDFLRGLNDIWLLKLDAQGDLEWQRTIGGNWEDVPYDLTQGPDGSYFICALSGSDAVYEKTQPKFGFGDYWIVKLDTQGNVLWDKVFGSDKADTPYDIRVDKRGNIVVAGVSHSDVGGNKTAPSKGLSDYWLIYLDPNGELLWDETYGGAEDDALTEMDLGPNGSIYMAGHSASSISGNRTEASRGFNDAWVVKTFCNVRSEVSDSLFICPDAEVRLTARFDNCQDCNYYWQDDASARDTVRLVSPESSETYYITGIAANGCYKNDSITVVVNSDIPTYLSLTDERVACNAKTVHIEQVKGGFSPYTFSLDGGLPSPLSSFDSLMPGNYRLAVWDANGCTMDTIFTVRPETNFPKSLTLSQEREFCAVTKVTIEQVDGGVPPYTFSLEDSPPSSVSSFDSLMPGDYLLAAWDAYGCMVETVFTVTPIEELQLELGTDFTINLGDSIRLTPVANRSIMQANWTSTDTTFCQTCTTTYIRPTEETLYQVTVTDSYGCTATDDITIRVDKDRRIFLPNAFSPNFDGVNDYFTVFAGAQVARIKQFKVFDRWGQLLFAGKDILPNVETQGWDGTRHGQQLDTGVYVFFVEVEYIDGYSRIFEGDVTLFR